MADSSSMDQEAEGWFQDDSSVLYLLCSLFLLLLYRLHLRSSDIRSQRLATPSVFGTPLVVKPTRYQVCRGCAPLLPRHFHILKESLGLGKKTTVSKAFESFNFG